MAPLLLRERPCASWFRGKPASLQQIAVAQHKRKGGLKMKLLLANKVKSAVAMSRPQVVTDFETKEPKTDANGAPLHSLQVALIVEDERPEVAKVTGVIKGEVAEGDMIALDGLTANYWTMNGKSGLALRAQVIRKAA
jgi:hypothetical protein